jgi:uncharacterized ferritin-like protein (DUF455 family)
VKDALDGRRASTFELGAVGTTIERLQDELDWAKNDRRNHVLPAGQATMSCPISLTMDSGSRRVNQYVLLRPGDVLERGKGGSVANRIKLLHALANIELWAIDLAWDIITRFAQEKINGQLLPRAFFTDFGKVSIT